MQLVLLTLLTVLSTTPISLAVPRCYPRPAQPQPAPDLIPAPSDCAYAIAHILSADTSKPPDPTLDPSRPFLPIASFRHNTCVVLLKTYSVDASPPVQRGRIREHGVLPLDEKTLLHAWSLLRSLAGDIQAQCVEAGRGGYVIGDLPEMSGGRLYAAIYSRREEEMRSPGFADYALSLKRRLIAEGEQWLRSAEELNTMDEVTANAISELWGSNPFAKVTYDV